MPRCRSWVLHALAFTLLASPSQAEAPNGAGFLRLLGPSAQTLLAPRRTTVGALVRVPSGVDPVALGLEPFVAGLARLHGSPSALVAFADAHPDLPIEVAPPPHLLLDQVGQWTHALAARSSYGVDGTGTLVGIADTGIDVSLADFMDPATGHSRVAWLLDLSIPCPGSGSPACGRYPEVEQKFGGAVYQGADIDQLLATEARLPADSVGHGTHVASIAAGNGGAARKYVGIAPGAQIVFARITTDDTDAITNDDLLTGMAFLFDRADAMHRPIAANLSIGSDFGPHDGTMDWEVALASYVGGSHPGHALVVAAGNSGDITASAVHANVFVPPGGNRSVAVTTQGSGGGGGTVQVWVTMRGSANLRVGLDGPGGTWIAPVASGATGSVSTGAYQAGVYNGSATYKTQIPADSHSAIVVWQGVWPSGIYRVTLTGEGFADLYVEASGGAAGNGSAVNFVDGVREGTVTLPGTHPAVIAVGCTVNRAGWASIDDGWVSVGIGPLDSRGGYPVDAGLLPPVSGKVCWFSGAGPTVTGVPKPEISAPGGIVIGAMSQEALPAPADQNANSIFVNAACPPIVDGGLPDPLCMEVDPTHAVAAGTSMSAPQAAGAAALLFQKDPTLTQDQIVALFQAGAHAFRDGTPPFEDQGGPGELDVAGSLDALAQMGDPQLVLPDRAASWLTLSADVLLADGSTPLTAIIELRTSNGAHRADMFAPSRLAPVVEVGGQAIPPPALIRRGPGVWLFTVTPPPGLGGQNMTVGATFDGLPIVTPRTIAIATETWTASYPGKAGGSCAVERRDLGGPGLAAPLLVGLGFIRRRRRGRG